VLVDVVAREEEAAEDVANHRDHLHRRAGGQGLVHRRRRVHPCRLVLREVLHDDVVAERALAGVGRLLAGQHPHQGRLAGAVGSDERDAIAALDVQVEIVEDGQAVVGLARVLAAR
jgi:hypothetical protein